MFTNCFTIIFVTTQRVNIETTIPIAKVCMKLTSPVPSQYKIAAAINVVIFPSKIAEKALLNPASQMPKSFSAI